MKENIFVYEIIAFGAFARAYINMYTYLYVYDLYFVLTWCLEGRIKNQGGLN